MNDLAMLALNDLGSKKSACDELARIEIMGNDPKKCNDARAYIKIDPVLANQSTSYVYTKGYFFITYRNMFYDWNKHTQRYRPEKPYKIFSDLTRENFCLSGWKNFELFCEVIPQFNFFKEKTTLNKKIFEIAKQNPNIQIPFTIDYEKCEIIKYGVFESTQFNDEIFQNMDYCLTIREIEKLCENEEVQNEIKQNLEEYGELKRRFEDAKQNYNN